MKEEMGGDERGWERWQGILYTILLDGKYMYARLMDGNPRVK
jgi:hypothetical protein